MLPAGQPVYARAMRPVPLLAILVLLPVLAACSGSPVFRDNYMGKPFVEPDAVGRPVVFDGDGKARPEDRTRSLSDLFQM